MKKHKLIGLCIACAGAILFAAGVQYAGLVLLIGIGWFIFGRAAD